ncbi:hypothetical protein SISNIDRAFT_486365 [Sistotremastrum niveocremeum HHB9708]|uniref:WD40 repeat-like protein n=1 Tax=Sistotremastrum niveocremeum HHB9708 TaxID=1314777 RepID=A0A164U2P6_9AGAM|nr:hypothetical protein SISNIDRAFT_486365 [Sistotremastrum niveocremeum HHB9708]
MPLQRSKLYRRSHSRRINCVSISKCSRYVATGAHELAVWDLRDTKKAACVVPTGEIILCLSWIESNALGWTIACGLHNGVLLTLRFRGDSVEVTAFQQPAHSSPITALSAYLNNGTIVTGGQSDGCGLWDRAGEEWSKRADLLPDSRRKYPPVVQIQALGGQSYLAILFKDGGLLCLSMESEEVLWVSNVDTPTVSTGLSVGTYGLSLITLKRRGEIRFHSTPDVRQQERFEISGTVVHNERLEGPMAFVSPDFVAVGCGDTGNADIWDLSTGRIVEHLNHEGASIQAMTVRLFLNVHDNPHPTIKSAFDPHTGLALVATVANESGETIIRVWESIPDMSAWDYLATAENSGYIPRVSRREPESRSRGCNIHYAWTIAVFTALGLFSLWISRDEAASYDGASSANVGGSYSRFGALFY